MVYSESSGVQALRLSREALLGLGGEASQISLWLAVGFHPSHGRQRVEKDVSTDHAVSTDEITDAKACLSENLELSATLHQDLNHLVVQ